MQSTKKKSNSSALSKHNNSDISYIYPGPPTAAKGASEKMFSGHRPPARVDRQREKGNKAECTVHKMGAGLPNYSRY